MSVRLRPNIVTIELAGHGEFATHMSKLAEFECCSRPWLADRLAEIWGNPEHDAKYWLEFNRSTLLLVYTSTQYPAN